MARVQVINEAEHDFDDPKGWKLLFQWCLYVYDDGRSEKGYRFIGEGLKARVQRYRLLVGKHASHPLK